MNNPKNSFPFHQLKAYILTEGGRGMGLGHLTRCISIYEAFKEKGIAAELIVHGDDIARGMLKGKRSRIFDWIKKKKELADIIKDSAIVVVDSYLARPAVYKTISKLTKLTSYIDDNMRIDYPDGVVINGAVFSEDMNYPRRTGIRYLLGGKYTPVRKEFWNVPHKRIGKKIKSVLVTFGCNDKEGLTLQILKFLNKRYPNLKKYVIVGAGFNNRSEIEALKDRKTYLIYDPGPQKMLKLIRDADLAISATGQTLSELACTGIPAIGICVSNNQLRNAVLWKRAGFLKYIGRHDDRKLIDKLNVAIISLKSSRERKNMSVSGRAHVNGRGSRNIVNTLISKYIKKTMVIRKAGWRDINDIFKLSMDATVRRYSFNPEKVSWSHHLKWFRETLRDKNCDFYVIEAMGIFIGQLRFYINDDDGEATVNISLVRHFRKLRLSSFALNKAAGYIERTHKGLKVLKALIKENNIVSMRTFQNAGFNFKADVMIKNAKAKIYLRAINITKKKAGVLPEGPHRRSLRLKVCFVGGSQAGIIGALTLFSAGHELIGAVSHYSELTKLLNIFNIPVYKKLTDKRFVKIFSNSDILINVHGRKILDSEELRMPRYGCYNIHPYLYKYKGVDPIGRALKERNYLGSVGVHRMEERVDEGKVIVEDFVDVTASKTRDEVYNKLYPYYSIVLLKALDIIIGSVNENRQE